MSDLDDPRVRLAAERTLLAWIRTGLAVMAFGFVVARHEAPRFEAIAIGFVLLVLGSAAVGLATWEYARDFGFASADRAARRSTLLAVWFAAALVVIGAYLVGSLVVRSIAERPAVGPSPAEAGRGVAPPPS